MYLNCKRSSLLKEVLIKVIKRVIVPNDYKAKSNIYTLPYRYIFNINNKFYVIHGILITLTL